ncbi:response regulator [Microbacterium hibisci]|uniref:response regulator n=1 Tax=Microbacterium hibisci TaxID=2036000 RepID=UPI001944CA8B|nr:response regulator transcription factor [Microbacterium hibisci]
MTGSAIRVMIVDDHPIVRDGLRGMFEGTTGIEVVAEAGDGARAVDLALVLEPDVILMDLRMPRLDGVAAIRRLAESGSQARVVVLTTFDTEAEVLPAIEAGATGYLLKDVATEDLLRSVEAAARGEAVLAPAVTSRLMGRLREPEPALSDRELEVLRLVAQGTTNRDIASALFLSEATVKTHLLHIYAKLGAADRAAAVAVGFQRGLLH